MSHQHRSDLVLLGHAASEVGRAVRHLRKLRHGAYTDRAPGDALGEHLLLVRTVAREYRETVVISHGSAALLHGYPHYGIPSEVTITSRGELRQGHHVAGVRLHGHKLTDSETTTIAGIRVTSSTRTVVDCARFMRELAAVTIADAALHSGETSLSSLRRCIAQMRGWKGVAGARRMVSLADPRCESPGETRARLTLTRMGYSLDSQVVISHSDGRFLARVDFLIKGTNVILEYDGESKYLSADDPQRLLLDEKRRQDALADSGYIVVRITARDLRQRDALDQKLRAALRRPANACTNRTSA